MLFALTVGTGTLDLASLALTSTGGLTVGSTGTLTTGAGTFTCGGDLAVAGRFNGTTGTLEVTSGTLTVGTNMTVNTGKIKVFGGAQLPKLAKNLGQAQKEFKKGLAEGQADDSDKK